MTFFMTKAIKPRKRIDQEKWKLAIIAAVKEEGEIVKRMYKKTVRTWSAPKPVFKVQATISERPRQEGGEARVDVFTTSEKFLWVDEGTRAHIIRPRRAQYLRFKVGGSPKTTPRVIGSRRGKPGKKWVTKDFVRHPGTKPRHFTKEIRQRRERQFHRKMDKAMKKAQRKYAW